MTMTVSDKLLQFAPLFRVLLAVSGGIIFARFFDDSQLRFSFVFLSLICLYAVSSLLRKLVYLQTACLFLALAGFGAWWYQRYVNDKLSPLPSDYLEYDAVVMTKPIEKGKVMMFDIIITNGDMQGDKIRTSLLKDTISRHYMSVSAGCGLHLLSKFENINLRDDKFGAYNRFLLTKGYRARTFILPDYWETKAVDVKNLSVLQRIELKGIILRERLTAVLQSANLEGSALSVISAMTLGDKSRLSSSTYEVYSNTGAAHILALSGMHIAIIMSLLRLIFRNKRFQLLFDGILLFAVWLFVIVVGMPTSAIRAALMVSMIIIGGMFGENSSPFNSLSLAALLILLLRPTALFDVGFQLSFVSVFFILLLTDSISSTINIPDKGIMKPLKWLWTLCAVTLAAQIGTFPLLLYYFEHVSLYFLLANLVALPAAYVIIISTIILFLSSGIPLIFSIAASVLNFTVNTADSLLGLIASLPYNDLLHGKPSLIVIIAIYLAEFILIHYWFRFISSRSKSRDVIHMG